MNCAAREPDPYGPVSELQVLAAVERAQRHADRSITTMSPSTSASCAAARPPDACAPSSKRCAWTARSPPSATTKPSSGPSPRAAAVGLGAARRRGALDPLPESPRHRTWRRAREEAATRLERICGSVLAALEEADEVTGGSESPRRYFEVSKRLGHEFWRLGVAIHCLREWPEPDDSRRDVDDDNAPAGRRAFSQLKERRG